MKRIWLNDVGCFEVVPNSGEGSCLFQAISQALTSSTKLHTKIRTTVVKHMTCRTRVNKLESIPEVWKRRIICDWLIKNGCQHLDKSNSETRSNFIYSILRPRKYPAVINPFVARGRVFTVNRIRKLLEFNNLSGPEFRKCFKRIFRECMSKSTAPGTRFELEAAANKFGFHYDFLQSIPTSSSRDFNLFIKPTGNNSTNRNFISNSQSEFDCISHLNYYDQIGCEYQKNVKNEDKESNEQHGEGVNFKTGIFQFYGCRSSECMIKGRGRDPLDIRRNIPHDHFYFLHTPFLQNPSSSTSAITVENGIQSGHWELMQPVSIHALPVPLNRRMVGVSYQVPDSARSYLTTQSGEREEMYVLVI